MGNPADNKYLRLSDNVKRTIITDNVISLLDKYFEEKKHISYVTSILREPQDQLRIIKQYAVRKNLVSVYPEIMICSVDDKDENGNYLWQKTWSELLSSGVIINPPREAELLSNYFKNGENKKGQIFQPSSHFKGTAFDIGGGPNGLSDEIEIVSGALSAGITNIRNMILERENNCLHINCY